MGTYKVKITEILEREINLDASSYEEALRVVRILYDKQEIVLGSDDYKETLFIAANEVPLF